MQIFAGFGILCLNISSSISVYPKSTSVLHKQKLAYTKQLEHTCNVLSFLLSTCIKATTLHCVFTSFFLAYISLLTKKVQELGEWDFSKKKEHKYKKICNI